MSLTVPSSPVGMPGTCTAGEVGGVLAHAARRIRSDPDFEATAPVAVTIGGTSALQIDVVLAPGATSCSRSAPDMSGTSPLLLKETPISEEQLVRLYLVDLPGGPAARVLAIAILHADVEGALELAAPIVDSIEFNTP